MPTTPPTLTPIPTTPPSTQDPANFDARMDATLGWLPTMVTEQTALAANMAANASEALSSANAAATSETNASAFASSAAGNAAAAATSSGAAPFAAGNYNAGAPARSNVNYRIYNARTSGAKVIDPSADPANWMLATAGGLPDVPYSSTTVTVSLNERSRFTSSTAVAVTVPAPTIAGEEWACEFDNGRYDNTVDIGAAVLSRAGRTLTGVITMNKRTPLHLVAVGANAWRIFV